MARGIDRAATRAAARLPLDMLRGDAAAAAACASDLRARSKRTRSCARFPASTPPNNMAPTSSSISSVLALASLAVSCLHLFGLGAWRV